MKIQFYYILEIQYLGFRYHGWQVQPDTLTLQKCVQKTLQWVLPENPSKILASGRTDKMVSVNHSYIEVFTTYKIKNENAFLHSMNENLPADIKLLSINETNSKFNIIQAPKMKEYHYYFACGEKFHPFCATLMTNILKDLDITLMRKAARLFEGEKDFYSYAFRPNPETKTVMTVDSCVLEENKELTATFFPQQSYVVKIKGEGFKRNQIRLMMGMLFELGAYEKTWDEFLATLDGKNKIKLSYIAPASGLQLFRNYLHTE